MNGVDCQSVNKHRGRPKTTLRVLYLFHSRAKGFIRSESTKNIRVVITPDADSLFCIEGSVVGSPSLVLVSELTAGLLSGHSFVDHCPSKVSLILKIFPTRP